MHACKCVDVQLGLYPWLQADHEVSGCGVGDVRSGLAVFSVEGSSVRYFRAGGAGVSAS